MGYGLMAHRINLLTIPNRITIMTFIQYYYTGVAHQRNNYTPKLIEVCGDRGVVVLDGRNSLETMHNDAVEFNGYRRPVYEAYQLFQGDSFSRCNPISKIINL